MLISTLFFTTLHFTVGYLDHFPTFELIFFRSIGSVICGVVFLKKSKIPLLGNNKKILVVRAIVGLISVSLFFKSIDLMPLGTAVSLRYISPFFTAVFAVVFLKEKIKKIQWLFFGTAFSGVILLKGFDFRISALGLFIVLTSAFFSGLVYVIIRKIGNTEHPIVVVNSIIDSMYYFFVWDKIHKMYFIKN